MERSRHFVCASTLPHGERTDFHYLPMKGEQFNKTQDLSWMWNGFPDWRHILGLHWLGLRLTSEQSSSLQLTKSRHIRHEARQGLDPKTPGCLFASIVEYTWQRLFARRISQYQQKSLYFVKKWPTVFNVISVVRPGRPFSTRGKAALKKRKLCTYPRSLSLSRPRSLSEYPGMLTSVLWSVNSKIIDK